MLFLSFLCLSILFYMLGVYGRCNDGLRVVGLLYKWFLATLLYDILLLLFNIRLLGEYFHDRFSLC
jgi:hypothetical protein